VLDEIDRLHRLL